MTKREAKKRIERLGEVINHHRYIYHVEDREEISEEALDALKKELFDLENQYPDLVREDSPTQRVAGEAVKGFKKVRHETPMLSLNDAFSREDIEAWIERLERFLGEKLETDFYCELKMDGLAVELSYEKGKLVGGSTRGDGVTGEEVINNLKTIETIPLSLKAEKNRKGKLLVRGEVYLTKREFERINREQTKRGEKMYANPRNVAAGSIRQLDPKVTASRKLKFMAYDVVGGNWQEHSLEHEFLGQMGFQVNRHNRQVKNIEGVIRFRDEWEKKKESLDYEFDGVVVMVNKTSVFDRLGVVGKASRGAIAYKFRAREATTKVKDVKVQVGRTGVLTPVAELMPVVVGGVIIAHATLHNYDEIKRLGLKIGDTVVVSRAGDVIPKIIKVLPELRVGGEREFKMPTKCPIGGSPVIKEGALYRCSDSKAAIGEYLRHFVARPAFDIRGLGKKLVKKFLEEGVISEAADIFAIEEKDIAILEGMGELSASNIVREIKKKKEISLPRFLLALGILHVGEETAILLANTIKEDISKPREVIREIGGMTMDELESLRDIGPKVAESIFEWFRDKKNMAFIEKMDKYGVRIKKEESKSRKLEGKTLVLTGTLQGIMRDEAKEMIRQAGGLVASAVSQKTDYVVAGAEPGSKHEKAKELGVKIINEKEFLKLLNN